MLLPLAAAALRLRGLRRVQTALGELVRESGAGGQQTVSVDTARRLARIVNLAAARGPWAANCLQRSVITWWLLERRGLKTEIHIGVRKDGATPEFHAWVGHCEHMLNDDPDVGSRYSPFDRPVPSRGARFD